MIVQWNCANITFHCTAIAFCCKIWEILILHLKQLNKSFNNIDLTSCHWTILVSYFASLIGAFHLSPHENILTIALINITYLYTIMQQECPPAKTFLKQLVSCFVVYFEFLTLWRADLPRTGYGCTKCRRNAWKEMKPLILNAHWLKWF